MRHQFVRSLAGSRDPNFKNVTLLLHGDGTNGGQNNTFLDSGPNNLTITRNGSVPQGSFSPYGDRWSNYFDGSGDFLSIPSNAAFAYGTGDFTVECWVYKVSSATMAILDSNTGSAGTFGFSISSTQILGYQTWGTAFTFTHTLALNSWQHIAFVRRSGSLYLYVNGILIDSTLALQNFVSTQPLIVGRNAGSGAEQYNGYISNLRIVKGAAIYTANFPPSAAPLDAITNTSLLICQSNRFRDASSNNFTITRNGDVSVQRFSPFSPDAEYRTDRIAGSAYFSGANSNSLSVSSATANIDTNPFTVESWVYYLGSNNQAWFTPAPGIPFTVVGTTLRVYYTTGFLSAGPIERNAWTHIAVTRDFSNVLRVFVNGVLNSSVTTTTAFNSTTPIIGERFGNGTPFVGYIAGFRLLIHTPLYTSNFTPPTSPPTVINDTRWLVNFTNASIRDNAMMNNLETVGNAQISTSIKKYGTGSLYFDGTGDWLLAPNYPSITLEGDFTIEAWVYILVGGANRGIITIGDRSTATGITLMWQSSAYFKVFTSGAELLATNTTTATNTWAHFALTRNGAGANNMKTYLNGIYQQTNGTANNNIFAGVAGNGLCVGVSYSAASFIEPHNGYICDLRITKGVARYTGNVNFNPPTAAFPDF